MNNNAFRRSVIDNSGAVLCGLILLMALGINSAAPALRAQSAVASLSGRVVDQSEATIPGAAVNILNPQTGFQRETRTNTDGNYTFPLLPPATYIVTASADDFAPVEIRNIALNVNDERSLQIQLRPGNISDTVTITSEASLVNESPSVGTVVDRQFVENIPLNGRSFQSLITLTPGIVVVPSSTFANSQGQFSVNGQRPSGNAFVVDGVSANVGTTEPGLAPGASTSGNLPGLTAFGTTQSLASVDALQEFSVQTSSYSAEYGRQPGGQISISTRSGTNQFHGSLFDYLRNDIFDSNDWFANRNDQPKAALRQNDFGGTFSGPLFLPNFGEGGPHWYNGRNRTFFFFSYEGLRLLLPTFTLTNIPSLCLRGASPCPAGMSPGAVAVRPLLNAFPRPNGRDLVNPANGQPNGLAEFSASYSNPSTLDATSLRIDHAITNKLTIFGRYNKAPSASEIRSGFNLNTVNRSRLGATALTTGLTAAFNSRLSNELRINFSDNYYETTNRQENFGGATPADRSVLMPPQLDSSSLISLSAVLVNFPGVTSSQVISLALNRSRFTKQRQFNIVDSVSYIIGGHQLKFGIDFRRLTPARMSGDSVQWQFTSLQQVQNGIAGTGSDNVTLLIQPVYVNFSAFGQDTWKLSRRLTLSLGLRWEVNPSPGEADGNLPIAVNQISDFSTMRHAPLGTPLWKTAYTNFAPRVGVAYQLGQKTGRETVVRGGFGLYYDTGNENGSSPFSNFPFRVSRSYTNMPFPLNPAQIVRPTLPNRTSLPTPYPTQTLLDPDLKLPYTLQWNLAVERSLGASQSLSVSYVGAAGKRLLQLTQLNINSVNPLFTTIFLTTNNATSDYHALQASFQRRLSKGLQALSSYTWSHAIDEDSAGNSFRAIHRGDAAFDVRHVFATAITYDIPAPSFGSVADALLKNWSVDTRIQAQSALPVDLVASTDFDLLTGESTAVRPNVVAGVPLYVEDSSLPGGRRINRAAFSVPPEGQRGNLGRNQLRGLPTWQVDLALRREFKLMESLKLQLRAEAFNVFNHPNFGVIQTSLTAANFGQATNMLNRQLGGISQLYQIGGPRSVQVAAKLIF